MLSKIKSSLTFKNLYKVGSMKTLKRTLILTDKSGNKKPQMILTIENKNGGVFGHIKTFTNTFTNDMLLGIKSGQEIIKQNVKFIDGNCQFKLPSSLDLDGEIACAMVDISDGFEPILWGANKGDYQKSTILSSLREHINKISSHSQIKEPVKISTNASCKHNNEYDFSQISLTPENSHSEQVAMASTHSATIDQDDKSKLFESSDEEIENIIDKNIHTPHEFYNLISDQLNELFSRYPREENLEALIDGSKWCKIDSDTAGRYYVVGLIYVDDEIKYICYGVPGNYEIEPPSELKKYSQWLPTDPKSPYTVGYWVMYQDSDTGENILLG